MKLHLILRNLLFSTILIYFSQGLLYPNGSMIAKVVLFLYLLICFFYVLWFINKKEKIGRILLIFITFNVIYWIIGGNQEYYTTFFVGSSLDQIKKILVALLTYFPFYYFSSKNYLSEKSLKTFFSLFFIITFLSFFSSTSALQEESGNEEIINGISYLILSIIPLSMVMWNKKTIIIVVVGISLVLILLAAKRGPIIGILFVIFTIFNYWLKSKKGKYKIGVLISVLIVLIGFFFLSEYIISENDFLQNRIKSTIEGNSSGRDLIYSTLMDKWLYNSNFFNFMFGYGFFSSYQIVGNLAHNDWLELVITMGLVGVIIYFAFYLSLIKIMINNRKWQIQDRIILSLVITILLLKSVFSMGYLSTDTMPLIMCLAYVVGKQKSFHENGLIKTKRNENIIIHR